MNLLDLCVDPADVQADKAPRPRCPEGKHRFEPTITVWDGETFERLTVTCSKCGHVRGRAS